MHTMYIHIHNIILLSNWINVVCKLLPKYRDQFQRPCSRATTILNTVTVAYVHQLHVGVYLTMYM